MLVNLKIVQHCREPYQGWLFLKIIAQHWKVDYQGWIFSRGSNLGKIVTNVGYS